MTVFCDCILYMVYVPGLGAVAAAVMSSVDSAILSSASVFTHNIYKGTLRKQVAGLNRAVTVTGQ